MLHGILDLEIEGNKSKLEPADTALVEAGKWHKFSTLDGVIVEETSSTHFNEDSVYLEEEIRGVSREERETVALNLAQFGRWPYVIQ